MEVLGAAVSCSEGVGVWGFRSEGIRASVFKGLRVYGLGALLHPETTEDFEMGVRVKVS